MKLESVTICPELVDFLLSCSLFLSNNWLLPSTDKNTVGDVAFNQQVGLWQHKIELLNVVCSFEVTITGPSV